MTTKPATLDVTASCSDFAVLTEQTQWRSSRPTKQNIVLLVNCLEIDRYCFSDRNRILQAECSFTRKTGKGWLFIFIKNHI